MVMDGWMVDGDETKEEKEKEEAEGGRDRVE